MSEPVAKRTRLSVSRRKNKHMNSMRKKHQELRVLYDDIMSRYDKTSNLLSSLKSKVQKLRQRAMQPDCEYKYELFEVEYNLNKVSRKFKYRKIQIFHAKQIMDNVFVDKLHAFDCVQSRDCILKMEIKLKEDPLSLERKQDFYSVTTYSQENLNRRCSPLHAAVWKGHVKCVKFLLEKGANVTSLTGTGESILETLYEALNEVEEEDEPRLEILKLLLEYGVSRMYNEVPDAGEWAIRSAAREPMEDLSLLLQSGATMGRSESRAVLVYAWEDFNLLTIKLLLLQHRHRLNFGPGSHVLCPIILQNWYSKMVLAGVPSNEFNVKLLEALQFYKAFGGKFPVSLRKDPNRDSMQYFKSYRHRRYFNDIKLKIKVLISNPLSLQEISRLAVRKCIRKDYLENIEKLEVPQTLQSFLRFDDVIISKLPGKFEMVGCDEYASSGCSESEDSDTEL